MFLLLFKIFKKIFYSLNNLKKEKINDEIEVEVHVLYPRTRFGK
jgi:hypothetical protein